MLNDSLEHALTTKTLAWMDALDVVSAIPELAEKVDAEWAGRDNGTDQAVGDQLGAMDRLCVEMLRQHGYTVRGEVPVRPAP